MLYFCATCGNSLVLESLLDGKLRFTCLTCPYVHNIEHPIQKKTYLNMKEIDDVIGGDDAWENVDKTIETCPNCSHNEAYFRMMQTRSADEPMTTFYKCISCSHNWRE
ncbi:DNA-directed RNA polymerase III subunit RPC10-like [Zophobas morio]|uniref:DNA-directed RNA polymerase III subunit RPC10-like n=1 Tax=Zophobas morio TaxID=2755281 RepID=UPI0030828DF8